jgi:hypothetical protein
MEAPEGVEPTTNARLKLAALTAELRGRGLKMPTTRGPVKPQRPAGPSLASSSLSGITTEGDDADG